MYTGVRLQNFRSYKDFSVELSPSVNIVVGPNASGKTNLLEALHVLNRGSSFRVNDEGLIAFEETWARVDGQLDTEESRSLLINNQEGQLKKELQLDGATKKRITAQQQRPTTLFEPEHLRFLTGSPELRRTYLDNTIAQTDPRHQKNLNGYKRALTQRNRLLKTQPQGFKDQLFVWDLKISEFGGLIVEARQKLIEEINSKISDIYSRVSDTKSEVKIEYRSSVEGEDYQSACLQELSNRLHKDLERGFTGCGPHRDDIEVYLNKQSAHISASRGETRTIVLALKIVELQQLQIYNDIAPLLLLDDVFSELDGARRRALTTYLRDYQTIITTTDADAMIKHFTGDTKIIPTDKADKN